MPKKHYHSRPFGSWWGAVGVLLIALVVWSLRSSGENPSTSSEYLTPVSSIQDAHGLAVDVADSSKVWIASHTGLHMLKNDKDLFVVGSARDDYMGFLVHPTDPNVFFASGHPSSGGNLGFQKTTDAARNWQKIGNGAGFSPTDFHALAVSSLGPNIVYGFSGGLQRSFDAGQSWKKVESAVNNYQVIALATDPKEIDTVYAATSGTGILVSRDQGTQWTKLSEALVNDTVMAMAINPANNQEILIYSQKLGLVKSTDGGQNWLKLDAPWAGSMVMYISYDRNKPSTLYAINRSLQIYKTTDTGLTWNKVR